MSKSTVQSSVSRRVFFVAGGIAIGYVLFGMESFVKWENVLEHAMGTPIVNQTKSSWMRTIVKNKTEEEEEEQQQQREEKPSVNNRQGICSLLPRGRSASSLWKQNLGLIANASRSSIFTIEPGDNYPDWLEPLLDFLSTSYLRKGYRQAPLPATYKTVLDIVYNRMQDPVQYPPLHVVVFGGSVTEGRNSCHDPFLPPRFSNVKPAPDQGKRCNWVQTVQRVIDALVGPRVVKISNLAIGGTGSVTSIPIIKYKLYDTSSPFLPRGPDVIVNAYSTNDAYVSAQMEDVTENIAWRESKRSLVQQFIRTSILSRPCSTLPMVVYFDDYIGNQHEILMGEMVNIRAVQEMSEWYNTFLVSYADAVRRLVYANTREGAFSGQWLYWTKNKVEVHFPMSGHFTAAWVMCFSLLQSIVDFCDDPSDLRSPPFPNEYPYTVLDLAENSMPPPLNKSVLLQHVSNEWMAATKEQERKNIDQCQGVETDLLPPCPFAFVAGPAGTVRNKDQINDYLDHSRVVNNDGWEGIDDSTNGWSVKIGYSPMKKGATTTFFIDDLKSDIKTLQLSFLKSYGEKWMESKALFKVRSIDANNRTDIVAQFELEGYHNSTVSISFPFSIDLSIPKGHRAEVEVRLIGGTTFKMISFMLCSH